MKSARLQPRSLQGLVITGGELREKVVLVEREMLREGDGDEAFFGIDLAVSGGGAVPAELSD